MAARAAQFKIGTGRHSLCRWIPEQYGLGWQKHWQAEITAEAAALAVQPWHQRGGGAGFAPHAVGNVPGETKQAGAEGEQVNGIGVAGNQGVTPAQITGQFPVFMFAEAGRCRTNPRSTALIAARVAGQVGADGFPDDVTTAADFSTDIKFQPFVGVAQWIKAATDIQLIAELYGPVLGNVIADMHQSH